MIASHAMHGCQNASPTGNSGSATRRQPYAPSFITTPASSIEAAVGAATWPVGAHVWNGHKPAKIAKPTNTRGKAHIWKLGGKGNLASSSRLMVLAPETTNAAIN